MEYVRRVEFTFNNRQYGFESDPNTTILVEYSLDTMAVLITITNRDKNTAYKQLFAPVTNLYMRI